MKELKYHSERYNIHYGNEYAAGIDLPFYDPDMPETLVVPPNTRVMIKTGVHMEIPQGHFGLLDSRSSTSKLVVDLLCRTIDEDYRGNIRTVLVNVGTEPIELVQGNYYFQILILKVSKYDLSYVGDLRSLSSTDRGSDGFGSTGNTTAK